MYNWSIGPSNQPHHTYIMSTWTITFGEVVENHAGMQQLGTRAPHGFSYDEVITAGSVAQSAGYQVEYYDLATALTEEQKALLPAADVKSACVIVVRQGARLFFDEKDYPKFVKEVEATKDMVDKKAIMRGRVVNKHARWNLCYADVHQEPNIEEGKGTIVAFSEVPWLNQMRTLLPQVLGANATNLLAELNYYFDVKKCGIGFHGDTERRYVVGVRIGAPLPLYYQWYHQSKPIGETIKVDLQGDDFYVMAEKATGTDWKTRKIPTLRHAAGYDKKYITPKKVAS